MRRRWRPPVAAAATDQARWGMLDTYCTECHNSTDWAGGIAFDTLTPADVPHDVKLWEAAVRKLRGHLMPPPGNKQPTQAQKDAMVGWLETSLDARTETPRAGHVPVQRLNRTEYANTVRSLLGVEIKVQDLLPPEIEVDGFDNIAAALQTSPAFLDQYLSAARFIAKQAVGSPTPKLSKTLYPVGSIPQDSYIDGMPLGSRGGISFRHNFVADGEYHISILDLDIGLYPSAAEWQQTLVMYIDGKEVFRGDIGGPADLALVDREGADGRAKIIKRFSIFPSRSRRGTRKVVVTFIERARALSDEYLGGIGGQNGGDFGGFGRLQLARLLNGVGGLGSFWRDRAAKYCQPRQDICLSSAIRGRRGTLCPAHRREPDASRLSTASECDGCGSPHALLCCGPQGSRQLRRWCGGTGGRCAGKPRLSLSGHTAAAGVQ